MADEELAIWGFTAEDESGDDTAHWFESLCRPVPVEFANRLFHVSVECRRMNGVNWLLEVWKRPSRDGSACDALGCDGGGEVDGPAFGGAAFEQSSGGVDGEGACDFLLRARVVLGARDGEHGGVVDGVAEDGVGYGDADATQGFDFAFVGGDVDDAVGGIKAVGFDACGEDAVGGDVEALDAFFDDPVVGGADGPDVAAVSLEVGNEGEHLREDVGFDVGAEEVGGGVAEGVDGETAVNLDHLAADVEFGDGALAVAVVAGVEPGDLRGGDELVVDGPAHERGAGVAGPEGAVAIEDSDFRRERVDACVEGGSGEVLGERCGQGWISVRCAGRNWMARIADDPVGPSHLANRILALARRVLHFLEGDAFDLGGEVAVTDEETEGAADAEAMHAFQIVEEEIESDEDHGQSRNASDEEQRAQREGVEIFQIVPESHLGNLHG